MTIQKAIKARHSVRAYKEQSLTEDVIKALEEKIACYIAIGYGETQGVGHKIKTVEQVSNASDTTPSWFKKGFSMIGYAKMDLGIAKYHFEVSAGKEIFKWV